MFARRLLATLYMWQNSYVIVEEGTMAPRRKDKWRERRFEVQRDADWFRVHRRPRVIGSLEVRTYVLELWDELRDQIEGIVGDLYVLAASMGAPSWIRGSKEAGTVRISATPSFAEAIDERLGYRLKQI